MTGHVVVAYATKHESTREVAEAIAARLREQGLRPELRPAREVEDVGGYDAVVLGGALYIGRWHRDARRFLARHRRALTSVPLAVFAMGPQTLTDDGVAESRAQLDRALRRFPELEPAEIAIFGGVIDPRRLRFPLNRVPATDARDWDAIRAWADRVARLAGGEVALHRASEELQHQS